MISGIRFKTVEEAKELVSRFKEGGYVRIKGNSSNDLLPGPMITLEYGHKQAMEHVDRLNSLGMLFDREWSIEGEVK